MKIQKLNKDGTTTIRDMTAEEIAQREADIVTVEQEEAIAVWNRLRSERNKRLSSCDWTQVSDSPVDKNVWSAYRQALRDIPSNTPDPYNPTWPLKPE